MDTFSAIQERMNGVGEKTDSTISGLCSFMEKLLYFDPFIREERSLKTDSTAILKSGEELENWQYYNSIFKVGRS